MKPTRNSGFVLCALVACFVLSGCGNSAVKKNEEAAEEMLSCLEEYCVALESVKDKESAKAAAPKIDAATERFSKLLATKDKLPKVTKAQDKKLEEKYMPKLEELQKRMEKAAMSAGLKCGAEPTFMASLKRMQEVGSKAGK